MSDFDWSGLQAIIDRQAVSGPNADYLAGIYKATAVIHYLRIASCRGCRLWFCVRVYNAPNTSRNLRRKGGSFNAFLLPPASSPFFKGRNYSGSKFIQGVTCAM